MFDLSKEERESLWQQLSLAFEQYYAHTGDLDVAPKLDQPEIVKYIQNCFESSLAKGEALDHVINGLTKYAVHTPHEMYFGLFNPRASFAGIMADTITAFFNPQIAAWSHAPFAAEVERYLISSMGKKFGYLDAEIDGAFTTGGAEANLTAILCAAHRRYPTLKTDGWRSIVSNPVIYCSKDCHHSIMKAANIIGLGLNAVCPIDTTSELRLDTTALKNQIDQDLAAGKTPMMVIATLGITGTGVIDDISSLVKMQDDYGFWLHADAAYGGAVILSEKYKYLINGIASADSITFDAHKWLSIPMSAGMFITKHPQIMSSTFGIVTEYMPKDASNMDIVDPFSHTIQWSRRFIGLKLYMSVLMYGWDGLKYMVERQVQLGHYLKEKLKENHWQVYNDTMFPVVCFGGHPSLLPDQTPQAICQKIVQSGKAWISVYKINKMMTLRACITNYNTTEKEIDALVGLLNKTIGH